MLRKSAVLEQNEAIVCTAHTNDATRVLAARTAHLCNMFGQNPQDHVVLLITPAKAQQWYLCERQVDSALAALTTDAHLLRFANQDSGDFGGFLAGTNAIAKVGRIEDKSLRKKYFSECKRLANVVKQKYKIPCCTLATANIGFFNDREFPARAAVLVVDEALQATDLSIIEAWIVLDPRRIILAGTTHNSRRTVARLPLNGPGCARSFESCLSEPSPRTSLTSNTARLPTYVPGLRSTTPSRSPMRPRPTIAPS